MRFAFSSREHLRFRGSRWSFGLVPRLMIGRLDLAMLFNPVPSPQFDIEPLLTEELMLIALEVRRTGIPGRLGYFEGRTCLHRN